MPVLKPYWLRLREKIKSYDSNGHFKSFTDECRAVYKQKPRLWQIIFLIFFCLILTRCYFDNAEHNRRPHIAAVLAEVKTADVPIFLDALGTVTSTYTVTVRTQINGRLLQVYFREGQTVKAGQVLAWIDPRPYEAQLIQYQGQYARDNALLTNARLDLKRYQLLWRQNSISKQILDTQTSLVQQDEGLVKIDLGLIQSTQLNLIYCQIISPINGRIGLRLVDPGNYVQSSDANGIAVVNMISPITVIFSLPEDTVPQLLKEINMGRVLPVYAYDRLENQLLSTGNLLTMDNQVDPTTGTVKLKGIFANTNNNLFPNQFVNVKLLLKTLKNAIVVPTEAIQHSLQGDFVYVANADNTVSVRNIQTSITNNGDTVVSGVKPGESVVTEGADKLTDGASIQTSGGEKRHHKRLGQKHFWRSIV